MDHFHYLVCAQIEDTSGEEPVMRAAVDDGARSCLAPLFSDTHRMCRVSSIDGLDPAMYVLLGESGPVYYDGNAQAAADMLGLDVAVSSIAELLGAMEAVRSGTVRQFVLIGGVPP